MQNRVRRSVARLCLGLTVLFMGHPVFAVHLEIVPALSQKFVGDVFGVDVVVSGLNAAGEIVSTFDLDVTYNPGILQALGVSYGPALGGGGAKSIQFAPVLGSGLIDFAEASLLGDVDLDALQGDSVTLASLAFRALDVGISPLEFVQDAFFILSGRLDGGGIPVDLNPDVGGGRVRVDPQVVPEPGVLGLLMLGLLGLGISRLRRGPTTL